MSVVTSKDDRRALDKILQRLNAIEPNSKRSEAMRYAWHVAASEHLDDVSAMKRLAAENRDLRRKLEEATRAQHRAEAQAKAQSKQFSRGDQLRARHIDHLPYIWGERVVPGLEMPLGVPLLDQWWQQMGSWRLVYRDLYNLARRLGKVPQKAPRPGAST